MGKTYKIGDKVNGRALTQLDIDLIGLKNKPKPGLANLKDIKPTVKPKVNESKKPIQKKPRPPTASEKLIKDLIARKERFSGGGNSMLFGD